MILDYDGGTYLSQVKARNPRQACLKWADQLDLRAVFGVARVGKDLLQNEIAEEQPVLLDGLKNVWCMSLRIRDKLAFLHVVQTAT